MPDLPIHTILASSKRPTLSYEFFPPKDDTGLAHLEETARLLLYTRPDFVTCTYGAGGSTRARTLQVCERLRAMGYGPVMPHLTCVGSSRDELAGILDDLHQRGYRNLMTLRGDPPKGDTTFRPAADGFAHASELVSFIKGRHSDFACGVAAYPEVHPEAADAQSDLDWLVHKLKCGGDFATTQLFFDNDHYFRFVERLRARGLQHPVVPGLLPAISLKQVQRMCTMCRTELPAELEAKMRTAGGEGEAAERVGIEWAKRQIEGLLDHGVPGIHLYVLNRSKAVLTGDLVSPFIRHRG